jgi:hypothetical protein
MPHDADEVFAEDWCRSFPLNAHLASAQRLELNDAFLQRRCPWRDQFDECGLACLSSGLGYSACAAQPFLQPHVVQPEWVCDGIHTVFSGQLDRSLPQ